MKNDLQNYVKKVNTLTEALPYIRAFNQKTVVIKYGGSAMTNLGLKQSMMKDIALMKLVGINPIIVHGGGKAINKALKKEAINSEFHDGIRITNGEVMGVVETVLAGEVNKSLVSDLQQHGVKAVGISGKDGEILICNKKEHNSVDLGFVGQINKVNTELITLLATNDFIPIIAPIGTDEHGHSYNINADIAAVEIAKALKAHKLIFLTDVPGIMMDLKVESSLISEITSVEIQQMIDKKQLKGGMIPKGLCCIEGIEGGVDTVHILDGRMPHTLLLEIFTESGTGTMVKGGR